MSSDHLLVEGIEGPVVVAVLRKLGVRDVHGGVPEVTSQGDGLEVLNQVVGHCLRSIKQVLHQLLGCVGLHVGFVLHMSGNHAEAVSLAVLNALLQEDLKVGDLGPCEGPDICSESSIGDVAHRGRDLLLQDVVHDVHELPVRGVGVSAPVGRRLLQAQAVPHLAHQRPEARALAQLRRGHLRGVAEGADPAEQHAGHLLVQAYADVLQQRGRQGQSIWDEHRVLDAWEAAKGELCVPEVLELRTLRGVLRRLE
mmetsp:Transcript_62416/g.182413  ORF Transcript_62416/g.182413 Transcript_62416/m.182413 type:complete len:254 (-) Transcript_62416:99-860(-)